MQYLKNQTTGKMKVYKKVYDKRVLVFHGFNFEKGWLLANKLEEDGYEVKVV